MLSPTATWVYLQLIQLKLQTRHYIFHALSDDRNLKILQCLWFAWITMPALGKRSKAAQWDALPKLCTAHCEENMITESETKPNKLTKHLMDVSVSTESVPSEPKRPCWSICCNEGKMSRTLGGLQNWRLAFQNEKFGVFIAKMTADM